MSCACQQIQGHYTYFLKCIEFPKIKFHELGRILVVKVIVFFVYCGSNFNLTLRPDML